MKTTKKKRRKQGKLLGLLFGCLFFFSQSMVSYAAPEPDENKVVIREPTTNVDTLYDTYKDNSFELMTQNMEEESLTGIKEAMVNSSATMKNFTWGAVKGLGQFNAEMVKYLFSMDVVTPIKAPIQKLTSNIAGNMLSIAGTIGIGFVTLVMGIKFIGEQRFRQALKVFLMTIFIFTGLVVCKDAKSADSLFNQMFEADKQIEAAFVKVNPVLGGTSVPESKDGNVQDRMKSAGELIASRVFYTNVYEPYLLMNYGTSNPETIRKKTITYEKKDYDRINILLDNDVVNKANTELHDKVTEIEADELNNRSIMYFNNFGNTFYGLFYLVVNLIQTLVYFILCFVRLVIAVLQVFLLPLLPIILLTGLFMQGINVFANYFKGFGFTIFMKAMTGFACIFFATFLSLGFQLSNAVDNPWQKILTILIYLLTPLGLYFFRQFLGNLFMGRVSLADAARFATNPIGTNRRMREDAKERKVANKAAREERKKQRQEALKKRQAEAEKQGADIGLKRQPAKEREAKRSALRRELKPKAQHKAPTSVERAAQSLQKSHENSKEQEAKEQQQLARQRQRKAYDKANLKTAAALVAANQALKAGAPKATSDKADPRDNQSGTQLRQNIRRTGQSSKARTEGQRSVVRRQGQKQTPPTAEPTKTETKPRANMAQRSGARSQHKVNGQKPAQQPMTPKTNKQTSARISAGNLGGPTHRQAPVRQKMQAVQQVIDQQATPTKAQTTPAVQPVVASPVTRMAKRNAPPARPQKPKKRAKTVPIRRSKMKQPASPGTEKTMKGMKQPRVRK